MVYGSEWLDFVVDLLGWESWRNFVAGTSWLEIVAELRGGVFVAGNRAN